MEFFTSPAGVGQRFDQAGDLRGFVESHLDAIGDPETAYFVSQALEECSVARPFVADEERQADRWSERAASAALAQACRGFEGRLIEPGAIVDLLNQAAERGEPRAIARMLLFRDIAAPKAEMLPILPALLATRDPEVVRDVGAFLSRGELKWRYGSEEEPADAAAIAWELAACDLGYACGPGSRLVLAQCAFDGRCAAGRYEDTLAVHEPVELLDNARRLRAGILRALREHDWGWLGLS